MRFALGHSEATPDEVRALGAYMPTILTHAMDATGRKPLYGGTRGVGPDEYCMTAPDMYAELISDSCCIHVHADLQRLLLHAKGVGRMILISDSTNFPFAPPENLAHVTDLNFDHMGGIAGSKLTMDKACRNVMAATACGIAEAFLMASTNPANAVGLGKELGSIAVGKKAALVFTDDKFNVQSVMLDEFVPEKGRKYAVVFGNEVAGVSQEVVDASDFSLEIPQFGTKHSLNVSVSVGVILWHFRLNL